MSGRRTPASAILLILLMALAVGPDRTQGSEEEISVQAAMGCAFTYQGRLMNASGNVTDTCNLQFELYDAEGTGDPPTGGTLIGTDRKTGVSVVDGCFTVPDLDFGSGAFNGEARWLQIAVQSSGDIAYATLSPRQGLTPVPYALALPGLWTEQHDTSPNLIGGSSANNVTSDVFGGVISGGGSGAFSNRVTDHYGVIGGGHGNLAGNDGGSLNDAGSTAVGGGYRNRATGPYATVAGGRQNEAGSSYAAVGGGYANNAGNQYATVGGGYSNVAGDVYTTIGGGDHNTANADYATVGGGRQNAVSNTYSTIGGGYNNTVTNDYAVVGGGHSNVADGQYSAVAGGRQNNASGLYAFIGGGQQNVASGQRSIVAGGVNNAATRDYSFAAGYRAKANHRGSFVWADYTFEDLNSTAEDQFLVRASGGVVFTSDDGEMLRLEADGVSPNLIGGHTNNGVTDGAYGATIGGGGNSVGSNRVSDNYGTIGGGTHNLAGDSDGVSTNAEYATIGGGWANQAGSYAAVGGGSNHQAYGSGSTVGGGASNYAHGDYAAIGGGIANQASQSYATVAGGYYNQASGQYATVPGGSWNAAEGNYSFAAGRYAQAIHDGSFVWGDGSIGYVSSEAANQFIVRAAGGVIMYTSSDLNSGATLPAGGGSWSSLSDRSAKANLAAANGREVLDRLADVPISTWNYRAQDPEVRHIGPMAQDFHAAFGVGESELYISAVDADGVALAAIQGLRQLAEEQDARIVALESENAALQERLASLESQVTALRGSSAIPGINPDVEERSY